MTVCALISLCRDDHGHRGGGGACVFVCQVQGLMSSHFLGSTGRNLRWCMVAYVALSVVGERECHMANWLKVACCNLAVEFVVAVGFALSAGDHNTSVEEYSGMMAYSATAD